jgi:sulfur relay (sulfurtransferase) DsrC/TusE family protein
MISSYIIFKNKGADFFEWIESSHSAIEKKDEDELTDEDKEIIHLRILMNYYTEIGIADRFFESEMKWHSSFSDALAV